MKSAVATSARPSCRYTPASSEVPGPISTRSPPLLAPRSGESSAVRSPGPTLAAQPPVVAHAVRRNFRRSHAMAADCKESREKSPVLECGPMSAALAVAPAGPRLARPWWGLAGLALFLAGLWLLAADVPAWNTAWYLFGWYGWLLALDALLARRGRSWLAGPRRRELPAMMLWSIPFWYLYEAFNLRLQNWYYVFALRDDLAQLLVSLLAFAPFFPACLIHAELAAAFWPAGRAAAPLRRPLGAPATAAIALLGVASVVAPLLWPRWAFPLVWGATLWLPELACRRLGAPSTLAELEAGRPQRLLHLLAGGLLAGLVWELLNFWARCKWIYTVPFFDRLKLFEMPLLGFLGFPPLAVGAAATWSLLQPVPRQRSEERRVGKEGRSRWSP